MAGLTPYGDRGEQAMAKILGLLNTVDVTLTKSAESIGAAADAVETSTARLEKGVAEQATTRGSRIGTSGKGQAATADETAAAEKRVTAAVEQQVAIEQRLLTIREANLAAVKQTGAAIAQMRYAQSPVLFPGASPLGSANVGRVFGGGPGAPTGGIPYGYRYVPPPATLPPGPVRAQIGAGRQPLLLGPGPTPYGALGAARAQIPYIGAAGGATGATQGLATATKAASLEQGTLNARLAENAARIGVSTQDLRSYGALTTQYFASLNRGAGTLKELGFQVTSTIQKFGGWLGAGAAVYGAVGAVAAIGKGAIDSSSGVQQLSRVVDDVHGNADKTSKSFRDLATHFNLPIADVADAAFGMGKAFHQLQPDLVATKAALYAVKVGEIDAGTATRYLVSIVNGFHLAASDLPGIFDQVVTAQKRYAIQLPDLLAGTAKAAGSFKQQGGDITHLIGLITLLAHVTGQSGTVIGTAIQRAPHFIAQQGNSATLQSYGIDPKKSIVDVFDETAKVAQGKSKEVQRQLGEAIFGPQYSSRFGGAFFSQQKLYNKILGDVNPEAAKGAAENQLQITLGKTSEILKTVITQLEVLGSNLADTGLFGPILIMVQGLDAALKAVNSLLEVFNALPSPLKHTLALLLDAAAVIKTLRFFNFGRQFPSDSLRGALFTRPNQLQVEAKSAITTQQGALAGRASSLAGQETSALVVQERTARELAAAQRVPGALVAPKDGEQGSPAYVAAQKAATKNAAATERLSSIQTEYSIVLEQQIAAAKALEAATAAHTDAEVKAALAAHGINPAGVARLGGGVPSVAEAERIRNARLGAAAVTPEGAAAVGTARAGVPVGPGVSNTIVEEGKATEAQLAERGKIAAALGISGGAIVAKGKALGQTASRFAGTNFSRIGTSVASSVSRFAAALGPMDVALIAFIGLPPLIDAVEGNLNDAISEADKLAGSQPAKLSAFKKEQAQLLSHAKGGYNLFGGLAAEDQVRISEGNLAVAQSGARGADLTALARGRGDLIGTGSTFFFPSDVSPSVQHYTEQLKKGDINKAKFDDSISNLITAVRKSDFGKGKIATLVESIKEAQLRTEGASASFRALESTAGDTLGGLITSYAQIVSGGLGSGKDRSTLIRDSLAQATRGLQTKGTTTNALKLRTDAASAIDSVVTSIQQQGQTNLQTSLTLAKGQNERDAAYEKYIKSLDPSVVTKVAGHTKQKLQSDLNAVQQHIALLKNSITAAKQDTFIPTGPLDAPPGPAGAAGVPQDLLDQLEKAQKNSKALRKALDGIQQVQHLEAQRLKALQKEQQQAKYQEDQAIFEAQTALQAGNYDAGIPQIEYQIKRIGTEISNAIASGLGRNSTEVLGLLKQQQDLIGQKVQEEAALIQANSAYAAAGINATTDPVGAAKAAIAGQERLLSFEQSHPGQYKASDIRQLEADIRQANVQLQETIYEQATALRDSAYSVQEAQANLTGHTVKAAQIAVNQAKYDLSRARTPQDKEEKQAALLNARQQKRQAIFDNEVGDIQFQAQIGQLTLAQQIAAYQHLLDTLKLTKQMRQQLKEQIYQLKQQDFDLDVGNIKLPTIYDIRRAVGGGVQHQTNVQINNKVNVDAKGNDNADEIGKKIKDTLGGANRSALKSAGLI